MNVILSNWEVVKFINHDAINYYLSAGETELGILLTYLIILGLGIIICTVVFGFRHKKYHEYM